MLFFPFYSSAPSYGGGGSDFDDFLNALAAFLPIALFLAAIPPNLVVVNNRKKRDADSHQTQYPFVRRINEIGLARFYNDFECQQKIFCEMASYQQSYIGEANTVQKAFHAMVTM